MAEQAFEVSGGEGEPSPWRALWVSGGALAATLALIGLIFMITASNQARDQALEWERRSYDVIILTRTIDATVGRSESALGRYVLDENQDTGTAYYNEWRAATYQVGQLRQMMRADADQTRRVQELAALLQRRNQELAPAASAAERRAGSASLNLLYQAAMSPTRGLLRAKLEEIARSERINLNRRIRDTQGFVDRADLFTEWLGWLAILIAIGAVALAILAVRAFREGLAARNEAESEAWRAMALEDAVQQRTQELSDANARLKAEAAERAAAEAQLRQVQKMEAVGQLTGGIAHDFNNMLAVVVGGIDLARRKLHGPRREVEFHLDNAMEGATRAAALTRRLLAFARSEPLMPEAIVPAELVENMLDMVDRTIGERISVTTRFDTQPWHIWADPTQLENAVLNLAVNARDAMEGSGDLVIAVDNATLAANEVDDLGPGDYVRIEVADTGAGIAPDHLERVFEPFFTTKPVGKGTGLGLTQIFGFARQSGGHATIDSTVGQGTRVTLYLPRFAAGEATVARRAPSASPALDPSVMHRGAQIMVVEDDPRVSRSTVSALEELGYRALPCAGGREALDALAETSGIDLVITDVMMPEMTGTELAAAMRHLYPDIPILFVTGYAGEAGDSEDLIGGELLRKPFTVSALAHAVETVLGRLNGSPLASADEAAE